MNLNQGTSVLLALINIRQPVSLSDLESDLASGPEAEGVKQIVDALKQSELIRSLPNGQLVVSYKGLQFLGRRTSTIRDVNRMYNLVSRSKRRGGNEF